MQVKKNIYDVFPYENFLLLYLARNSFLQSGRGLEIIATRRNMHVFCQ